MASKGSEVQGIWSSRGRKSGGFGVQGVHLHLLIYVIDLRAVSAASRLLVMTIPTPWTPNPRNHKAPGPQIPWTSDPLDAKPPDFRPLDTKPPGRPTPGHQTPWASDSKDTKLPASCIATLHACACVHHCSRFIFPSLPVSAILILHRNLKYILIKPDIGMYAAKFGGDRMSWGSEKFADHSTICDPAR